MSIRRFNSPVCRSRCSQRPRATRTILCLAARIATFAAATSLPGAEVDISKLPPSFPGAVDFQKDVRPILEQSCLRCHGPERPKSHFRLDNRESALKGGDNNHDDIVPVDSRHSRLIQYVAGLVEDVQMPPPGKAPPLTPGQIGVLRTWIDQGANWGATTPPSQAAFSLSPTLRWVNVKGDSAKFREVEEFKEGSGGGLQRFSMEQQTGPDTKFSAEGHFSVPDDELQLKLDWTKTDLGFVRGGVDRWRRYYDDTGGYYRPLPMPSFDLGRDLQLTVGRVWANFGLALPRWPLIVLGYEYQFKEGDKSMLEWGPVSGKNIYPAAKHIDERTHIVKLDVTQEWLGWTVEDHARAEFFSDSTADQQGLRFSIGPAPDATVHTSQGFNHVLGANTFRFEKQIEDWWFVSGGYLFTHFDGTSDLSQSTTDPLANPVSGPFWAGQVTLRRDMHAFSIANSLLPISGLSFSAAAQCEFSRQEGFGNIALDNGDPNIPGSFQLQPATVQSDLDETKIMEDADLRYTGIPFTVLFAQGRFSQDRIGQFEREAGTSPEDFLRNTDYVNDLKDGRAGFSTSPWRWIALEGHYRYSQSDSDYNHLVDQSPSGGLGYSAFIRARTTGTDEAQGKLVLHPASWIKTSFTYQWTESDYFVSTDPVQDPFFGAVSPGGPILAGTYRAQGYGVNLSITPVQGLFLSGSFTYNNTRTITATQGNPALAPYEGSNYGFIGSASYVLNPKTILDAAWSYSHAGYGQNNVAAGLPLGLDYTRQVLSAGISRHLTKAVTSRLQYSFFQYSEPSSGGINDFTGHGVFGTLNITWF